MNARLLRARAYGLFAVASAAFAAVMATLLWCWWAYGVAAIHPEEMFFAVLCGLAWTTVGLVGMLSNKQAAPAAAMDSLK